MSDTGKISLYFYLAFIIIAIVATILLYSFLKKGTLENDKIDKLVDFFKTVVYTTAFGAVALIVSNLFKEREQNLKEIEHFEKYIQEVKDVKGDGRRQLTKFLSIVAPKGEMREAWKGYNDEVERQHEAYLKYRRVKIEDSLTKALLNGPKMDVKDFENKVSSIASKEKLDDEIKSYTNPIGSPNNLKSAQLYERLGFEALLYRNYEDAKLNFNKSYAAYPSFHNTDAISRLLNEKKIASEDSWRAFYETILKDYSWGMPEDVKHKMSEIVKLKN